MKKKKRILLETQSYLCHENIHEEVYLCSSKPRISLAHLYALKLDGEVGEGDEEGR